MNNNNGATPYTRSLMGNPLFPDYIAARQRLRQASMGAQPGGNSAKMISDQIRANHGVAEYQWGEHPEVDQYIVDYLEQSTVDEQRLKADGDAYMFI